MNLSRCEKGHFFDKEKYAVCPHCQGELVQMTAHNSIYRGYDNTVTGTGATGTGKSVGAGTGYAGR